MLSFVVAVGNNNVIGKDNSLAWNLPDDLKRFKEITMSKSKTMIMGRKTFEALPKILPERKHIIITRNKNYKIDNKSVEVLNDIDDLKPYIESDKEYFVIGGGEIFSQLLPFTKKIYLTRIYNDFHGDTFFPSLNKLQWKIVECSNGTIDCDKYIYKFFTLMRI